jgi:tRNA modification GTPase
LFAGYKMAFGAEERKTIFALASGVGRAGISVIRLSGPSASLALGALVGRLPASRQATLRKIVDPADATILDSGLVLWFPAPNSFTGEDCAELHVHGARAVVAAVLNALGILPDLRPAKAGEFARRALENGKLDLIGIEALGDLIHAETEQQRRFAISQTEGHLRGLVEQWRERLIDALVLIESELDFSDEADAPNESRERIRAICGEIIRSIAPLAIANPSVERLREGLTVLIAGPPNAGKSTLLNAIARREIAIVSERAGTTRDLIEVKLDLGGYPVNLIDTAGIRASEDPIEKEGIDRAIKKSAHADLILWLTPAGEAAIAPPTDFEGRPIWSIWTKADIIPGDASKSAEGYDKATFPAQTQVSVSARSGENFGLLMDKLRKYAEQSMAFDSSLVACNERQRFAICEARDALIGALDEHTPIEILAEELRRACFSLESLIGKVGVEDVLDRLFSRFCIGK